MLQHTQVYGVPAKCYSIPRCMGCLHNVTVYPGVWGACVMLQHIQVYRVLAKFYSIPMCIGCLLNVTANTGV